MKYSLNWKVPNEIWWLIGKTRRTFVDTVVGFIQYYGISDGHNWHKIRLMYRLQWWQFDIHVLDCSCPSLFFFNLSSPIFLLFLFLFLRGIIQVNILSEELFPNTELLRYYIQQVFQPLNDHLQKKDKTEKGYFILHLVIAIRVRQ